MNLEKSTGVVNTDGVFRWGLSVFVFTLFRLTFSEVPSPNTNQFYLKVRFGRRERLFAYDTLQEARDMVYFLDEVLKCKEA